MAGLLEDALAASDRALARVSLIEPSDHQFVGFNMEHWVGSLRGRILVRLGRFAEAERQLTRCCGSSRSSSTPPSSSFPISAMSIWPGAGRTRRSRRTMRRASRRSPNAAALPICTSTPVPSAARQRPSRGISPAASIDFADGLEFARAAKAAMEYEADMLAGLADCHYNLGSIEQAITASRAAIELAAARTARLPECRASITCAAALISCPDAAGKGGHWGCCGGPSD